MASFASSATTGGARKHAWTKIVIINGQNSFCHRSVAAACTNPSILESAFIKVLYCDNGFFLEAKLMAGWYKHTLTSYI